MTHLQHPSLYRVSLLDVHDREVCDISKILLDLAEFSHLLDKRWSAVATKVQHQGPLSFGQAQQPHVSGQLVLKPHDAGVGCRQASFGCFQACNLDHSCLYLVHNPLEGGIPVLLPGHVYARRPSKPLLGTNCIDDGNLMQNLHHYKLERHHSLVEEEQQVGCNPLHANHGNFLD